MIFKAREYLENVYIMWLSTTHIIRVHIEATAPGSIRAYNICFSMMAEHFGFGYENEATSLKSKSVGQRPNFIYDVCVVRECSNVCDHGCGNSVCLQRNQVCINRHLVWYAERKRSVF